MGRAFHRKRISLGRYSKTRGVGIGYMQTMAPAPRELTAGDIAARELENKEQVALEEGRRLREWNIKVLVDVGEQILRLWQKTIDANEKRLAEFNGWWTTENVCSFPPDDAEVAAAYLQAIGEYAQKTGSAAKSLEERDAVFDYCFHYERRTPLTQVVEEAKKLVCTAAEKCCDREGIDKKFIDVLLRRSLIARGSHTNLDSAMAFLHAKMTLMFDVLEDGEGREDFDAEMAEPEPDTTPLCWVKMGNQ